jgi:hypothetical protein
MGAGGVDVANALTGRERIAVLDSLTTRFTFINLSLCSRGLLGEAHAVICFQPVEDRSLGGVEA